MSKKMISNTNITILTIILAIFMLYGGCAQKKGQGTISITNTVDKRVYLTVSGLTSIEKTFEGVESTYYDILPGKYTVVAIWYDSTNVGHPQIVSPSSFDMKEGKTVEVVITAAPPKK